MALIFRCAVNPDLKEHHDQLFCEHAASPSCYGGYKELCGFLQKYCKASDRILTAGCALSDRKYGDSLIEDLYDAGYHSVVVVGSSESCITSSRERNKEKRPGIHFVEGHVLNVRTIAFLLYLLQNTTVNWRFKEGSPSSFDHCRESQFRGLSPKNRSRFRFYNILSSFLTYQELAVNRQT